MTDFELIDLFKKLMPFLGKVLGKDCEIILHDLSTGDTSTSIVAIENNMTNRSVGESLTKFGKEIISDRLYEKEDFITDYNGYTANKLFLSSTFFIKNRGNLVGFLCINKDISAVKDVLSSLNNLLTGFGLNTDSEEDRISETLETDVENMVHIYISNAVHSKGVEPSRLSKSEKTALVHELSEKGVLKTRGAVTEIAKQLGVSEPTVYRYLKTDV